MSLKARIQNEAYRLGADLVGFGGIDRCAQAPLMMSSQGLSPRAKTVIGYRLIKCIEALGYKAVMSKDLTGTDSLTANPRGPQSDLSSALRGHDPIKKYRPVVAEPCVINCPLAC